jgi:drug/metabolite transporter superfamily protein YnfA
MNVFEKNEGPQIFQLGIDETAKAHLLESTRWAKFLAILSLIGIALLIVFGLIMTFAMSAINTQLATTGPIFVIIYLILGLLYFYPVWALLKFANMTKTGLHTSNQQQFNEGLRYQKNMFKFLGVMAIIVLALYGILIVFGIIGAVIGRM